jgi:hypothetical protein
MSDCVCGCGGTTKGGAFLPGHDARHKSTLFREARAGNADALAEIDQRNWMHLYDKSVAKRDEPAARKSRSREALGIPDDGLPKNAKRLDWKDRPIEEISDDEIWDTLTEHNVRVEREIKQYGLFVEDIEVGRVHLVEENGEIKLFQRNGSSRTIRARDCRAAW